MSTFAGVRAATGTVRPGPGHGCKPVEVIPGVWTAHFKDIGTKDQLLAISTKITVVVNSATDKCPDIKAGSFGDGIDVVVIDVLDDPEPLKHACGMPEGPEKAAALAALPKFKPEECCGTVKQDFERVNAAIDKAKRADGCAMVHCAASISRSAAFILAYMMKDQNLSLEQAIKQMKPKWDACWPNDSFVRELLEYERELRVRTATGTVRPGPGHGCQPVEVVPGVWTAHFKDIGTKDQLLAISPKITVVVNSATDKCPDIKAGSFGDGIDVVVIDVLDDPELLKHACGMPEGPEKEAALAALPNFKPEECCGTVKQDFERVNAAIDKAKRADGCAMVHCAASISRSAAFILAYMMKDQKISLEQAVKQMRPKWDACWPNDSFVRELLEYEKELQQPSSFSGVRAATGTVRPGPGHGCKPVEVVPGVWTAHFKDIETKDQLLAISPKISVVVNSATDKCPDIKAGSFGDGVDVVVIDVLDDPEPLKHCCGMPEGPEKEAALAALPKFKPEECCGTVKQDFERVNAAIDKAKRADGCAMVHCAASISRSAAFILAYMMKDQQITLEHAVRQMKPKWDATWPNDSFVRELLAYERELQAAAPASAQLNVLAKGYPQ